MANNQDYGAPIIKQPPNGATYTRSMAVGGSVVGTTALVAYGMVYAFQVLTYFYPGFPTPDFVRDPAQLATVAGAIAGLIGGGIAFSLRGTTVPKDPAG